jgi:hypothetical protein
VVFPQLSDEQRSTSTLTIQDLLRHTFGLTYDFVNNNPPVREAHQKLGPAAGAFKLGR